MSGCQAMRQVIALTAKRMNRLDEGRSRLVAAAPSRLEMDRGHVISNVARAAAAAGKYISALLGKGRRIDLLLLPYYYFDLDFVVSRITQRL